MNCRALQKLQRILQPTLGAYQKIYALHAFEKDKVYLLFPAHWICYDNFKQTRASPHVFFSDTRNTTFFSMNPLIFKLTPAAHLRKTKKKSTSFDSGKEKRLPHCAARCNKATNRFNKWLQWVKSRRQRLYACNPNKASKSCKFHCNDSFFSCCLCVRISTKLAGKPAGWEWTRKEIDVNKKSVAVPLSAFCKRASARKEKTLRCPLNWSMHRRSKTCWKDYVVVVSIVFVTVLVVVELWKTRGLSNVCRDNA